MKDKVVNKIMLRIKNNNSKLSETKLEEIRYGLLGLYSLTTKFIVILMLALLFNMLKEFILFLIFYGILRSVGFGTHAKSNIQCWISSIVLLLGIPYLFINIDLTNSVKIILWFISILIFLTFCPADTENRPIINKKLKIKYKISIIIISFIYLFIIIKFKNISNLIIASMILEAFLASPLGYMLMGQKIRFKLNDINFNLNR